MCRLLALAIGLGFSCILNSGGLYGAGPDPIDPLLKNVLCALRAEFDYTNQEFKGAILALRDQINNTAKVESRLKRKMFEIMSALPEMEPPRITASNKFIRLGQELEELLEDQKNFKQEMIELINALSQYRREFLKAEIKPLIAKTAFGIPTEEALRTISNYSPLVELGAGNGYWVHELKKRYPAVDVLAYDNFSLEKSGGYAPSKKFAVAEGDESVLTDLRMSLRNLILIWPPADVDFPLAALRLFKGEYFIYVGEMPGDHLNPLQELLPQIEAATGSQAFFAELSERFDLVRIVELPNWPAYHDSLYVFRRKAITTLEAIMRECM